MKKLLIITSLAILLLTPSTSRAVFGCSGYNDVEADDWFCPAVSYLQELGVLSIMSLFNPTHDMNRAEGLKVLYEASGKHIPEWSGDLFDIGSNDWFKPYFYAAYANHHIKAPFDRFDAHLPMTKAEFLILYLKIMEVEPGNNYCDLKETGALQMASWAFEPKVHYYLCKAQDMELASKEFDDDHINRAVAMQILYNSLTK